MLAKMKEEHKLLMRTCEFPKSSKPTSKHNSSLLSKNERNLKTDAFLLTLPMAMPPSVNVSIVLLWTVLYLVI